MLGRFCRILILKRCQNAFEMIQNFKVKLMVPFVTRIRKFEFALDFKRFRITRTRHRYKPFQT